MRIDLRVKPLLVFVSSFAVISSLGLAQYAKRISPPHDFMRSLSDSLDLVVPHGKELIDHKMRFWQPDSGIDYKIHSVNPLDHNKRPFRPDSTVRLLSGLPDSIKWPIKVPHVK